MSIQFLNTKIFFDINPSSSNESSDNTFQHPISISQVAQTTLFNDDGFYYPPIEPPSPSNMSDNESDIDEDLSFSDREFQHIKYPPIVPSSSSDDESDIECEPSSSSSSNSPKKRKNASSPVTTSFAKRRRISPFSSKPYDENINGSSSVSGVSSSSSSVSSSNSPNPFEQTAFTSYNVGLQTIEKPYEFQSITAEEWESIKDFLPKRFVQDKYAIDFVNAIIFNFLINCLIFIKNSSDISVRNNHYSSSKRRFEKAGFTDKEKLEVKYVVLKYLPKYQGYFEIPRFGNTVRYGQSKIIKLPSPEFSGLTHEQYNQLLKGENDVSIPLIDHIIEKGLGYPDRVKKISYSESHLRSMINNNNFGLIARIEKIILADPKLAPYWTRHLL